MLVGSLAFAGGKKGGVNYDSLSGRVVDLSIYPDSTVVVVMRGRDTGIEKGWRATFREGDTTKLLPEGDAAIIRIDSRSCVLKTKLTPDQVRANRIVQFDPP